MVKFLRAGENFQISNFIGWFCLEDKLLEQKIDTSVSCPDTEGLWTVSANSESWFPIKPPQKWVNFLWAGEKLKISSFIGLFCVKDKLQGQKTERAVYCPDTE